MSVLVGDAARIVAWADMLIGDVPADQRETVADQVGLFAVLAGQDGEPAEGSDGTDGHWRIVRRTAPDRVISTVDPQARHIRKTTQNKHDGFKAHLVAEPDTGIVTQVRVSSGCGQTSSDAFNAQAMIAGESGVVDGSVSEVHADSAYDEAGLLDTLDDLNLKTVIKPRPLLVAVPGGFSLDDFGYDPVTNQVTCPAGHQMPRSDSGWVSFTAWCGTCPLKPSCTTGRGRMVRLSHAQLRHRRLREQACDPDFTHR